MRLALTLIAPVLAVVFTGCGTTHHTHHLGSIESRNRSVTVKSTPDGPRYTVTDRRGVILGKDLDLSQLQARDPRTATLVKGGIALDADVSIGRTIWMGRD